MCLRLRVLFYQETSKIAISGRAVKVTKFYWPNAIIKDKLTFINYIINIRLILVN